MITPEYIKKLVEFKTGVNDISIKSNKIDVVNYRYITIALCKEFVPKKLRIHFDLAVLLGYIEHSNVSYGYKTFKNSLKRRHYKYYKEVYDDCKKDIESKIYQNKINNLNVEYDLIK